MLSELTVFFNKLRSKYRSDHYRINAVIARYFLYFFGLLEILFLPKLLDQQVYSDYEYHKNAIFIFPNIMFGAYSGYMYVIYSKGYDFYESLFKVGLFISIIAATIVCAIFSDFFLFIPLIIINFYVLIEQKLKVRRQYIKAFLFKPLLSIVILAIGFISFNYKGISIEPTPLILTVFTIALLFWFPFVKSAIPDNIFNKIHKFQFRKYYYLVNKIFSASLASFVFGLLIFSERFFVEKYYPSFIVEYSFVFNLSQIMVIILSVFSYISSVEYGEKINTINKDLLVISLKKGIVAFLVFFILFLVGIYFVSFFYKEFLNILWMTSLLAISKGFFFFVGIYSPIAIYKDYSTRMLKVISVVLIINIIVAHVVVFFGGTIVVLLTLNALLLLFYSLYILDIVFRKVDYSS